MPILFINKTIINMKKLILLAVVACSFVAANAKTVKETFKVGGNCETCKERIEKTAKGVKGVISANWNSKTKQLALVFDDKSTSVEKVQKAIAAVGHDAGNVKASKAAYDKLPGCCKYQNICFKSKRKVLCPTRFRHKTFFVFRCKRKALVTKRQLFHHLKELFCLGTSPKIKVPPLCSQGLKTCMLHHQTQEFTISFAPLW